jgi:hypothetical protein
VSDPPLIPMHRSLLTALTIWNSLSLGFHGRGTVVEAAGCVAVCVAAWAVAGLAAKATTATAAAGPSSLSLLFTSTPIYRARSAPA